MRQTRTGLYVRRSGRRELPSDNTTSEVVWLPEGEQFVHSKCREVVRLTETVRLPSGAMVATFRCNRCGERVTLTVLKQAQD